MSIPPRDYPTYIESRSALELAAQLRRDEELCKIGALPSLLALHLPKPSKSLLADSIAGCLTEIEDSGDFEKISLSLQRLRYEGVLAGIKGYLAQMTSQERSLKDNGPDFGDGTVTGAVPSTEDLRSTLKTLSYLQTQPKTVTLSTPLVQVINALYTELSATPELRNYRTTAQRKQKAMPCYICRLTNFNPHKNYLSLCEPCGSFNLAQSSLSKPENLNLRGKIAVITGGRINLGFHTALRLLRCGANVIVSSRYPLDAEIRYMAEDDSEDWRNKLKIVGADFRTANDAFRLVAIVKDILRDWAQVQDQTLTAKLDILINNAAQTLTDSKEQESRAIEKERELIERPKSGTLLARSKLKYQPRIRGGAPEIVNTLIEASPSTSQGKEETSVKDSFTAENSSLAKVKPSTIYVKSSWVQHISEVPYEDVISAQAVNAFVPLILCRELLPSMVLAGQKKGKTTDRSEKKPNGYIVNVSSREGIFEADPNSRLKAGHHVHTNMSKAALNMLTETEASAAWVQYRVSMNTIDPGYMSADPSLHRDVKFVCPIGWEDGAARLLWPIALGEGQGVTIWGRFLKHFGSIDVDVGKGR